MCDSMGYEWGSTWGCATNLLSEFGPRFRWGIGIIMWDALKVQPSKNINTRWVVYKPSPNAIDHPQLFILDWFMTMSEIFNLQGRFNPVTHWRPLYQSFSPEKNVYRDRERHIYQVCLYTWMYVWLCVNSFETPSQVRCTSKQELPSFIGWIHDYIWLHWLD